MHSAVEGRYYIQGAEIKLRGDPFLATRISDYFRLLYQGEARRDVKSLTFEMHLVKEPPQMPPDACEVIEGPNVSNYRSGEKILFVSNDSTSLISLDPEKGEAKGFISREFSENPETFFSLVGSPIIETLKYQGLYFLHAACVYGNGKAYLFSGNGGTGKTTASYSLVRQGFQYVSDDSLFFTENNEQVVVSPFYTHFHIDENLSVCFPELSGGKKLKNFQEGVRKVRVNMLQLYPDSFVPSLIPDYIIFPRIVPVAKSFLSPLNQKEVYTKLLKQTILAVDTHISRNQLTTLEKLAKQVEGFELINGRDTREDPNTLAGLLTKMEYEKVK